jgi:hypothetical protein
VISEGIFAQGVEEEATPLAVLCGVAIEDDGHQSTKVLNGDDLGMKRSSEGLCMGDDGRVQPLHRPLPSRVAPRRASVSAMASRWQRRQIGFTAKARRSQEQRHRIP